MHSSRSSSSRMSSKGSRSRRKPRSKKHPLFERSRSILTEDGSKRGWSNEKASVFDIKTETRLLQSQRMIVQKNKEVSQAELLRQEHEKEARKTLVRKVQMKDLDFCETNQFAAGVGFFVWLAIHSPTSSDGWSPVVYRGCRLSIWVPDTLVFYERDGEITRTWFATNEKDGNVHRYDDFSNVDALMLSDGLEENQLIAVLKKSGNGWSTDTLLLNVKDFKQQINLSLAIQEPTIIQTFIPPRSSKVSLYRYIHPSRTLYSINSWEKLDECKLINWKQVDIFKCRTISPGLKSSMESLLHFLPFPFTNFTVDFICDSHGRIWTLQVKAFNFNIVKRNLKYNRKNIFCHCCQSSFVNSNDLTHFLTFSQIRKFAMHLIRRNQDLPWCYRSEFRIPRDFDESITSSPIRDFKKCSVCSNCYSLHQTEIQLMNLEKVHAKDLGIPIKGNLKTFEPNEFFFKFSEVSYLNKCAADESFIAMKKDFQFFRLMFFVHDIIGLQPGLHFEANKVNLSFVLFNKEYVIDVPVFKSDASVDTCFTIHRLLNIPLYCTYDDVHDFLSEKPFNFDLTTDSGEYLGSWFVNFAVEDHLQKQEGVFTLSTNSFVTPVNLRVSYQMQQLVHINAACVEVHPIEETQLYRVPPHFFTCDGMPGDFAAILPKKKKKKMLRNRSSNFKSSERRQSVLDLTVAADERAQFTEYIIEMKLISLFFTDFTQVEDLMKPQTCDFSLNLGNHSVIETENVFASQISEDEAKVEPMTVKLVLKVVCKPKSLSYVFTQLAYGRIHVISSKRLCSIAVPVPDTEELKLATDYELGLDMTADIFTDSGKIGWSYLVLNITERHDASTDGMKEAISGVYVDGNMNTEEIADFAQQLETQLALLSPSPAITRPVTAESVDEGPTPIDDESEGEEVMTREHIQRYLNRSMSDKKIQLKLNPVPSPDHPDQSDDDFYV
ncbi:hypothetical protein PCE1_000462 [Barthelona sp. PCE]